MKSNTFRSRAGLCAANRSGRAEQVAEEREATEAGVGSLGLVVRGGELLYGKDGSPHPRGDGAVSAV